jgi:hypothetical protein
MYIKKTLQTTERTLTKVVCMTINYLNRNQINQAMNEKKFAVIVWIFTLSLNNNEK